MRRKHPAAMRYRALELAKQVGYAEASKQTKISSRTIYGWAKKEERGANVNGSVNREASSEAQISFAYGYLKARLEAYAERIGVPWPAFASRMGELLRREASGKRMGSRDTVL